MDNKKDISKHGYKDNSPYKDRPYLDIHTPNGVIDMDGVSVPLLANNVILGPNSGLHKFDTNMVREIPLAQDGSEVKDYFTAYLNSDLFKRRAIDLHGEEEWEKVRDGKLKRLEDTEVDFSGEEEWAEIYARDYSEDANIFTMMNLKEKFDRLQSSYKRPNYRDEGNLNPIVKVNPGQAVTMGEDNELSYNPFNSILANEYSHALGATHPNTKDNVAQEFLMTEREREMTREKGSDFLWSDNNLQIPHDTKSHEIKSDIDTTRYELWKAGLYNFEEDFMFDQSHIDYIRENPDKFIKDKQLLEQFDDNQVVDMMNTFTSNDEIDDGSNTMMAKYGGSVKQSPYNKEKLVLKNQDGVIADMMHNGAFLPKFQMGSEKNINTPDGNKYKIKKKFDRSRELPYINVLSNDIDDRVYYDKDDENDDGNFQIIDVAQQMYDQKRAHEKTKELIRKYKNAEKLSPTGLQHLVNLGIAKPDENKQNPVVEKLMTPPPSPEPLSLEELDVSKDIKNVTLDGENFVPIDDQISMYMAHASNKFKDTPYEKKLKRIYDKLNRVYYNDSKKAGLSTIEYMKSLSNN